ncbi:tetratricopeptide repeat protein [Radiobacillus sp. PE A8.2]|uniref:tetratricopeptide repeat protein n=1 Tax=Radiobacillus sp. PE A8.2 TaxID=3380349 RepID=UPI00388DD761
MQEIHEAIKLMENNQTEAAIDALEQFLPQADEEEKFTIAELYMQWGMLEEAKKIIANLIQHYPNESELKMMLVDIHIDLEEDEEAIDILNQVNREDEDYLQALIQLADLYQAQGLFEVAEQKLLEAKNIDPGEPLLDFALGELAFSLGEYVKAIPYFEKIVEINQVVAEVDVNLRLAEAFAATGEFEQSLEYYQTIETDDPESLFRYGFVAYRADRLDIAIKAWEKLVEFDPNYLSVYYYLAQAYETEGLMQEAYDMANKGLQQDEFNKELFYLAGQLAHKLGDLTASVQHIKEAVAIDPGYQEAVLFLVNIYKQQEDPEAIIDLLSEVLQSGEEDPAYKWELAQAYVEIESFDNALNLYMDAYNNLKDDTDFLKEYGYFLIEEGRNKEAIEVFTHYLSIEPADFEMEEFLFRLKQKEETM